LRFLTETCAPLEASLAALGREATGTEGTFPLDNDYFGGIDAEVLYCMTRLGRARQIVECGSGFSTRLMRKAVDDGKLATNITAIDPDPRIKIDQHAGTHIRLPVEQVEISVIVDTLSANDILFIDSSHRVTTGGDVPYLCLEVLPKLDPGVLIHFHDIFLPFDYPEDWVVEQRWGWTEQYLVHAFLAYNQAFEILWPARYMWEYHRQEVECAMPVAADRTPTSLWLRKIR
jgi:predicted O-methyltransferase YrrM